LIDKLIDNIIIVTEMELLKFRKLEELLYTLLEEKVSLTIYIMHMENLSKVITMKMLNYTKSIYSPHLGVKDMDKYLMIVPKEMMVIT